MPELLVCGNLNDRASNGRTFAAGPFCALAIGPKSLVDAVKVSCSPLAGHILRVGQVLPITPGSPISIEPFRAYRHGTGYTATGDEVNNYAEVIAWRECEAPAIVPFSRSPWVGGTKVQGLTAAGAAAMRLRVPFQGRRMAKIACHGENVAGGGGLTCTFTIYGVSYRRRDALSSASIEPSYTTLQAATAVPMGVTLGSGLQAEAGYIGGTDSAESFDELEVWLDPDGSAGTADLIIQAEAWGENTGSL